MGGFDGGSIGQLGRLGQTANQMAGLEQINSFNPFQLPDINKSQLPALPKVEGHPLSPYIPSLPGIPGLTWGDRTRQAPPASGAQAPPRLGTPGVPFPGAQPFPPNGPLPKFPPPQDTQSEKDSRDVMQLFDHALSLGAAGYAFRKYNESLPPAWYPNPHLMTGMAEDARAVVKASTEFATVLEPYRLRTFEELKPILAGHGLKPTDVAQLATLDAQGQLPLAESKILGRYWRLEESTRYLGTVKEQVNLLNNPAFNDLRSLRLNPSTTSVYSAALDVPGEIALEPRVAAAALEFDAAKNILNGSVNKAVCAQSAEAATLKGKALGTLAAGLGINYAVDRYFFEKDKPGFITFVADTVVPVLSFMTPAKFTTRLALMVGAHVAAKWMERESAEEEKKKQPSIL